MQRVRKMVSVPDEIAGGREKVTIAVLDTGERVALLPQYCRGRCPGLRDFFLFFYFSQLFNAIYRLTFWANTIIINN